MLAVVLMSSVSFAQYYASKQDAKNGKLSVAHETSVINSNHSVNAIFFSDDFETADLAGWTTSDADADGFDWFVLGAPNGHNGGTCAASESWNSGVGALTPDNWLISGAIDLSAAGASTLLDFWRNAQDQTWPSEKYAVYLSTSGNTVADFTGANGHVIQAIETVTANGWQKRSISLAAYTGGTVYIAFRHYNCSDMYVLDIDDVEIYENATVDGAITAVVAPNNATCGKTATENVTITIFNYGGAALTGFQASYSINGGAPVTETVNVSIPAASSIDFTFTQTADLSALGYYDFDFAITVAGDVDNTNDTWSVRNIANGDDQMTIDVSSDSNSGQAWYVTNMVSGDTIASHGAYQWNLVNDITTVCLNNADCYNFSWVGGTSNDVVVSHGATVVDSRTATGDYQLYGIGSGCAADDAVLNAITVNSAVQAGNINVTGTITNTGSANLTSFDVVYSVDGGTSSAVYTVTGQNIATGANYNFTHNVPWNATVGTHNLSVTISNFNGNGVGNSTLAKSINVLAVLFTKNVVYEEGTGTWCGWCPRGLVGLSTMAHNVTDGTWIGVAVHNSDPMVVTEHDNAMATFIGGYPSGIMDRHAEEIDPGLSTLEPAYQDHLALIPVAKIEIASQTWNTTSRAITVEVAVTFAMDLSSADYNVAVIVLENGVTGTTSAWNQTNYYAGGTYGDLIDWDGTNFASLTDPVPAADMVFNHVSRALLGGFAGVSGVVPASVVYNTPYTHTFTHTLPATQDENEVSYVAIVIDNATGEIVNAIETPLDITSGIAKVKNANFNIYPNPTTGLVKVEGVEGAQVIVYNMIGEVVYNVANAAATTTMDLSSLNAGNYIVKVINNNEVSTQKIVLTK